MARRQRPSSFGNVIDIPFGEYEKHVLRRYALALLTPGPGERSIQLSDDLAAWYREHRVRLGVRIAPVEAYLKEAQALDKAHMFRTSGTTKVPFTAALVPEVDAVTPRPSAFQLRLDFIARSLKLSGNDAAFLAAAVRLSLVPRFRELYEAAAEGRSTPDEVNAPLVLRIAGVPDRLCLRTYGKRSPLAELGLIEDRGARDIAVSEVVLDILRQQTTAADKLRASLFGTAPSSTLEPADFAHLGRQRERLLAVLGGALERRVAGANVLFHGPPGTGKTEFARLLGAELDAEIVFIGETGRREDRGEEPTRQDRLAHLAFATALADRAGRVILVVDEADDILTGVDADTNRVGSKVFMNRVVENGPVPMVWITNNAHRFGPAILRRMLMAVEFREPDAAVKRRIVARHAARAGLAVDEASIARLAALPGSPALIGAGLRAADLARGSAADVAETAEAVIRSLNRVAGRTAALPYQEGPMAFDPALSNADTDLAALEERVVAAGPGALSFLFAGLPGTGKSAFARHLADRLGLRVIEKRASDLLGMFVGDNERNIAEAFAEAAESRAFLLFDEVDSLLSDRSGAARTWEVSLVNEMLTHMERHPLPFAATTNLASRLDPAVQRRFLFKAAFRAMTAAQKRAAFARAFGAPAPASIDRLDPLTPGDFALVARKSAILGETDPAALAAMLGAEVEAKPGAPRRIGF